MAWLHAVPEGAIKSRAETITEFSDVEIPLDYLAQYLESIGYGVAGFNGLQSIGWVDLKAWQELTQTPLNAFECDCLMMMSRAYCSMAHKAKDKACPSPLAGEMDSEKRSEVEMKLDRAFDFLNRK